MTKPDARHGQGVVARQDPCPASLCCPVCSAPLRPRESALVCVGCARPYPVDAGIVDLRQSAAGVAAGGTNETTTEALPLVMVPTPEGWTEAVRSFLEGKDDDRRALDGLISNRDRVWRGFLDLKHDSRLLLLGCDFGSLVESLAPNCGRVFILEPDLPKLRFVQQRLRVFNPLDAVVLVAGSAEGQLPFADGAFDGVVVTEPAVFDPSRGRIGEVRRIMRDQGQLVLLADNRFSLSLPLGWWDRWTAAAWPLPELARGIGLAVRWWQKRAGAMSLASIRGQIASAGFAEVEAYGLWPARRQFEEVIPLRGVRALPLPGETASWKRRLRRKSIFLPAHCLIAQAGGRRRQSSHDRIFMAVSRHLAGSEDAEQIQVLRYLVTRKDKMIIQATRGDDALIIRVPLAAAAAAAEGRHAAALTRLADSHPHLAPRILARGQGDGINYLVETALAGRPLSWELREQGAAVAFSRVEQLLEALNPAISMSRAAFEGEAYERLVEARLERLFHLIRDRDQQKWLRAFFRTHLYGARLPFGLVHGDFSASNIYLAKGKMGLIDWEAVDFGDLPILDAIGYLESTLRRTRPERSLAESFRSLAWDGLTRMPEELFLSGRYERLGIDPACHRGLVYLRWLRQIDHLMPYWLRYDPAGQELYVHQVIQALFEKPRGSQ